MATSTWSPTAEPTRPGAATATTPSPTRYGGRGPARPSESRQVCTRPGGRSSPRRTSAGQAAREPSWSGPGPSTAASSSPARTGTRATARSTRCSPCSTRPSAGLPTRSEEQHFHHLMLSGSALPAGQTVHGIASLDQVCRVQLREVHIGRMTGDGIHQEYPHDPYIQPGGWTGWHVFSRYNAGHGYLLRSADSNWTKCLATNSGRDGWHIDTTGNTEYLGCRSEWSGQSGYWYSCRNNEVASGAVAFTGCRTDRSAGNGFLATGGVADPAGPDRLHLQARRGEQPRRLRRDPRPPVRRAGHHHRVPGVSRGQRRRQREAHAAPGHPGDRRRPGRTRRVLPAGQQARLGRGRLQQHHLRPHHHLGERPDQRTQDRDWSRDGRRGRP